MNENLTFSHIMSGKDNEQSIYEQNKVRVYRDLTTDSYVKAFQNDDISRLLFIDFTYNYINARIQVQTNIDLIANNMKPLSMDENIFLIFKGGNVMNVLFHKNIGDFNKKVAGRNIVNLSTVKDEYGFQLYEDFLDTQEPKQYTFNDFFESMKKNFRVSDVDYTLCIVTPTYARYIAIHDIAKNILLKTLEDLSQIFNLMFLKAENDKQEEKNYTTENFDIRLDASIQRQLNAVDLLFNMITDILKIDDIKTLFKKYELKNGSLKFKEVQVQGEQEVKQDEDKIESYYVAFKICLSIIVQENDILINNLNLLTIIQLIKILKTIILILYLNNESMNKLLSNNEVNAFTAYKVKLSELIDERLEIRRQNLIINQFYSKNKIEKFKLELANAFNTASEQQSFKNKKYEVFNKIDTILVNKYQYDPPINQQIEANPIQQVEVNNIKILPRNNVLVKSTNEPFVQQGIKSYSSSYTNFHYITYNNIINKPKDHLNISFDLARIKFNVVLDGNFIKKNDKYIDINIPAEFIDVSIAKFNDTAHHHYNDSLKSDNKNGVPYKLKIEYEIEGKDIHIMIDSYNTTDIFEDLLSVLFLQNNYIQPWIDMKYDKRIIRSLYFGIVDSFSMDGNKIGTKMEIWFELFTLINKIHLYIKSINENKNPPQPFPYREITKFFFEKDTVLTEEKHTYVKELIDLILVNYENVSCNNLLIFSKDYSMIHFYLLNIILFGFLYKKDDILFKLLNYNRKRCLFVEYLPTNMGEIITSINNHCKKIRETIMYYGLNLYYMFETIAPKSNPVPVPVIAPIPDQQGGTIINKSLYRLIID